MGAGASGADLFSYGHGCDPPVKGVPTSAVGARCSEVAVFTGLLFTNGSVPFPA